MNEDQITEERLVKALGISTALAAAVAWPLEAAARQFDICGPKYRAALIAQLAHESGNFQRLEENLNYSARRLTQVWPGRFRFARNDAERHLEQFKDGKRNAALYAGRPEKIANEVYANRMGNGPPESGDGWKYRGRGYIQLTGRAMYSAYEADTGVPAVAHPELLATHEHGARSAAWYWNRIKGCKYVREGDFEGLTKRINGGLTGYEARRELLGLVEEAFDVA